MTDDRRIYLVTHGEYSDYGIDAIVTTEDDARELVEMGFGETWREEPVRAVGWRPTKHMLWSATASVGKVNAEYDAPVETSAEIWFNDDEPAIEADEPRDRLLRRGVEVRNHALRNRVDLTCHSTDRERAVRIVSDAVAKLKAEREGL